MAKLKVVPPPPPPEEEDNQDCPKCPPVGAPAWMATFADMATLLMAFFVLILSFAEFNQPRFKMIAGSLREAFGVQRLVPVMEMPEGTTVIEQSFSPSPSPSVTQEMTQQTTNRDLEDVDTTEPKDTTEDETQPDPKKQEMADKMKQELEGTGVDVKVDGDQIEVQFPEGSSDQTMEKLAEQLQQVADAMETAGATGEDVKLSGLTESLGDMADAMGGGGQTEAPDTGAAEGEGSGDAAAAERRAGLAEAKLEVVLQQQIDQGLVEIERRDGKVFVTVGSGGAFGSGSADLTGAAREIMAGLALASAGSEGTITVTGHTDNVPLSGGQFTDNWGLAAGRASAVVRELGATGLIDPSRMTATSKGESEPIADNATAEGREQNRRIEIEIDF